MTTFESKFAIGDTVKLDGKLEHGGILSVLFERDLTGQADYVIGYIVRFPGESSRVYPEPKLRPGGLLLKHA